MHGTLLRLPLDSFRGPTLWKSCWSWVGGAAEHTACLLTFTALLQRLPVCNQCLNVSADVRAGFTTLHQCVRTKETQKECEINKGVHAKEEMKRSGKH